MEIKTALQELKETTPELQSIIDSNLELISTSSSNVGTNNFTFDEIIHSLVDGVELEGTDTEINEKLKIVILSLLDTINTLEGTIEELDVREVSDSSDADILRFRQLIGNYSILELYNFYDENYLRRIKDANKLSYMCDALLLRAQHLGKNPAHIWEYLSNNNGKF